MRVSRTGQSAAQAEKSRNPYLKRDRDDAAEIARLREENEELRRLLSEGEYAISNSARLPWSRGPHTRPFDYEDFCVWAEYWTSSARAALGDKGE